MVNSLVLFLWQRSLPSPKSKTMQYCLGKTHVDCISHIYGENHWTNWDFFFFATVFALLFRSVRMEQNRRAVKGLRCILCTQNVTGLNPACDLCWMSYPQCIQSFQLLLLLCSLITKNNKYNSNACMLEGKKIQSVLKLILLYFEII